MDGDGGVVGRALRISLAMAFITTEKDDFFLRVAEALAGCQLVEQELKLYISEALELVQKLVAGKLPFSMSGKDYEDASLERLVQTFRKLSDEEVLLKRLNKFKDERNFLSHRAITTCMDPDQNLSYPELLDFQRKLSAIAEEARALRLAIHEAANKFRVHLWFDSIDNTK